MRRFGGVNPALQLDSRVRENDKDPQAGLGAKHRWGKISFMNAGFRGKNIDGIRISLRGKLDS
jgi:hypothetical protein